MAPACAQAKAAEAERLEKEAATAGKHWKTAREQQVLLREQQEKLRELRDKLRATSGEAAAAAEAKETELRDVQGMLQSAQRQVTHSVMPTLARCRL